MENEIKDKTGMAAEAAVAMTYGMSDELRNSDLLTKINDLSIKDKECLIRYISEEIADDMDDDNLFWNVYHTDLPPYTLEELHERIKESEAQYQRGEYYTAEESDAMLRKEFLWLQ